MPSLAYRRRLTHRIVGGFALFGLFAFLLVQWGEFMASREHVRRAGIDERASRLRHAAPP